jgi:hypothetical protein
MTYEEAIDAMFTTFSDAWNGGAFAIVGYVPDVRYEGLPDDDEDDDKRFPNAGKYWARVTVRNALEQQATLGTPHGPGTHEYDSFGTIRVQLFMPKKDGAAMVIGRRLGMLARNAFRGVASGDEVWYSDATLAERAPETRWYRIDVTATYRFRETV